MKKNNIRKLVGVATLASLVVVLQLISNYIQFGTVSITLALIPMVIGAIIYGPLVGLLLGGIMGVIVLTSPSTMTFFSFNAILTILLCILKTGLAGFVCGWLYKGLIRLNFLGKAKLPIAIILPTLIAPIINTGMFVFGTAVLFQGLSITSEAGEIIELVPSQGGFGQAFLASASFVIITNFVVEFAVCAVLSPSLIYLVKILGAKFNLSFQKDFQDMLIPLDDSLEVVNIEEENKESDE